MANLDSILWKLQSYIMKVMKMWKHIMKVMTNLDSILKSRDITLQGYGFSSSHVWMWELDYKESWTPKNWCLWTVVLEKTLESPWTARRSN